MGVQQRGIGRTPKKETFHFLLVSILILLSLASFHYYTVIINSATQQIHESEIYNLPGGDYREKEGVYLLNKKLWGTPQNLTKEGVDSAISLLQTTIKSCPEFQCRGWPGRKDCTNIIPNPTFLSNLWSPIVSAKDCPRTKFGSWNFDSNGSIDFIILHLFFLSELVTTHSYSTPGRLMRSVEFGAQNGIDASNTRFFERYLGWETLLIEPTSCHQAVRRHRPKATVIHGAVCKDRRLINLPGSSSWCSKELGVEKSANETVQCYPLRDVFEMHGRMTLIDFVSVDTEGLEMEALESIDFSVVDIRVFVVEWRSEDGNSRRDYLAKFGYLSTFIGRDELFWRPDLFSIHTN